MNDELEEIYPKLKQVIKIAEDMLNTVESELRYREHQIAKKEILTKDEIEQRIHTGDNLRDQTIIAVLLETGMSVTELINLNVGSVVFTPDFEMYYSVSSTGGNRRIYSHVNAFSYDYVNRYLMEHPFKIDKTKPLFCTKSGLRLTEYEVSGIIVRAGDLAEQMFLR